MVGSSEQTPGPPSIDSMSEQELRGETIERIDSVLGDLHSGPAVDGTGAIGYKRKEQGLPGLKCSYFQLSKSYDGETQVGVQIALMGIWGTTACQFYKNRIQRDLNRADLTTAEQERLNNDIQTLRRVQESVARDGIAPAYHRYYFLPLDSIQPAVVSTESFVARAHRVNPDRTENILPPGLIANKEAENAQAIDEVSGQPRSKIANLQDFRDALAIIRRSGWFVKEVIEKTPKEYWGRPGLTED